ncbi:MAG: bis-aminopropyl spermidine synthase family protein [Archaeoglobaceae archaeon]
MESRIKNQVLQLLADGERSVYELIDKQDASLPEFFNLMQEMQNEGSLSMKNGRVSISQKVVDERLKDIEEQGCSCCLSTGYQIDGFLQEVQKKFEEIAAHRPKAIEEYDQGFISPVDIMKRIAFIYERGDLLDSRIFVAGDDDLFSIAVALTGIPQKVWVGEIDERLVSFINDAAKEHSLPVEANNLDIQHPLPPEVRGKFDIFVTDPVETVPGLTLFLSRGVSALRGEGCSGYFGLTTLEASRKKWFEIEKRLHDMGFVITDLRRKFSDYPQMDNNFFRYQEKLPIIEKMGSNVDYDWYKSTFCRVEAVEEPKPMVEGEMILDDEVYRDDESWATPY